MAAVLCADLVGYSRKPVADQFAAKDSFRRLLQGVLAPLGADSRLVLDTGDGAAIAFLADPEHALYVALELRDELAAGSTGTLRGPEELRIGINLGPVRRMVDLNGQPNLVGEGMNTAERIMSFAAPGEITASRAFCEAISCLRESYRLLFEPLGPRADKHGREHELFRVNATRLALDEARSSAGLDGADDAAGLNIAPMPVPPPARDGSPGRSRGLRWAASALVVALGGLGVAWLGGRKDHVEASLPALPAASTVTVPDTKPSPPAPVVTPEKGVVPSTEASSPRESPAQAPATATRARASGPAPVASRPEIPVQREKTERARALELVGGMS